MRDAKTLDASRWLDGITVLLEDIGRRHGVAFRGSVETPLNSDDTVAMLRELEAQAALTAMRVELPPCRRGGVSVTVYADDGAGGGLSFDMPRTAYDRRITDKLANKVQQIRTSGANWLLVDWMDHLWHMTTWGARPSPSKHVISLLHPRTVRRFRPSAWSSTHRWRGPNETERH